MGVPHPLHANSQACAVRVRLVQGGQHRGLERAGGEGRMGNGVGGLWAAGPERGVVPALPT